MRSVRTIAPKLATMKMTSETERRSKRIWSTRRTMIRKKRT